MNQKAAGVKSLLLLFLPTLFTKLTTKQVFVASCFVGFFVDFLINYFGDGTGLTFQTVLIGITMGLLTAAGKAAENDKSIK